MDEYSYSIYIFSALKLEARWPLAILLQGSIAKEKNSVSRVSSELNLTTFFDDASVAV